MGKLPPPYEDCVTHYESLGEEIIFFKSGDLIIIVSSVKGGNTTEVAMMDLSTIGKIYDEMGTNNYEEFKNASYLGLHEAMDSPPIGVQRWLAPSSGVFT